MEGRGRVRSPSPLPQRTPRTKGGGPPVAEKKTRRVGTRVQATSLASSRSDRPEEEDDEGRRAKDPNSLMEQRIVETVIRLLAPRLIIPEHRERTKEPRAHTGGVGSKPPIESGGLITRKEDKAQQKPGKKKRKKKKKGGTPQRAVGVPESTNVCDPGIFGLESGSVPVQTRMTPKPPTDSWAEVARRKGGKGQAQQRGDGGGRVPPSNTSGGGGGAESSPLLYYQEKAWQASPLGCSNNHLPRREV